MMLLSYVLLYLIIGIVLVVGYYKFDSYKHGISVRKQTKEDAAGFVALLIIFWPVVLLISLPILLGNFAIFLACLGEPE